MTSIRALLAYNMKSQRRRLGISQERLAERVKTSMHYIAQIEQKNKFPSPDMIERIAAALEIDTPQLFSMIPFTDEAAKLFREGVLSDLEAAITQAVDLRLAEFKKLD